MGGWLYVLDPKMNLFGVLSFVLLVLEAASTWVAPHHETPAAGYQKDPRYNARLVYKKERPVAPEGFKPELWRTYSKDVQEVREGLHHWEPVADRPKYEVNEDNTSRAARAGLRKTGRRLDEDWAGAKEESYKSYQPHQFHGREGRHQRLKRFWEGGATAAPAA